MRYWVDPEPYRLLRELPGVLNRYLFIAHCQVLEHVPLPGALSGHHRHAFELTVFVGCDMNIVRLPDGLPRSLFFKLLLPLAFRVILATGM